MYLILSIIFIVCSDFIRFSTLTKDLLQEDIQGTDKYPENAAKTYELPQEYEASSLAKMQDRYNNFNQGDNNDNHTSNSTPRVSFYMQSREAMR